MIEQPSAEVEIGRRYERYVGCRYESAGWRVVYHEITKGVADRGRDLVCYNGNQVQEVQCKCWKAEAKIPRDVIENLAHTAEQYRAKFHDTNQLTLEYPGFQAVRVVPVLISSCGVSWEHGAHQSYSMSHCASRFLLLRTTQSEGGPVGIELLPARIPSIRQNQCLHRRR